MIKFVIVTSISISIFLLNIISIKFALKKKLFLNAALVIENVNTLYFCKVIPTHQKFKTIDQQPFFCFVNYANIDALRISSLYQGLDQMKNKLKMIHKKLPPLK